MIAPTKDGYLLLFHGNDWYKKLSHEQLQNVMKQNGAWMQRLINEGKVKAAQPLGRSGAIVSGPNGRHVSDGPFAESKEVIGGYLLLDVPTMEEAIAIAKGCPNLAHGGSMEVRPLTDECECTLREQELAREAQLATA